MLKVFRRVGGSTQSPCKKSQEIARGGEEWWVTLLAARTKCLGLRTNEVLNLTDWEERWEVATKSWCSSLWVYVETVDESYLFLITWCHLVYGTSTEFEGNWYTILCWWWWWADGIDVVVMVVVVELWCWNSMSLVGTTAAIEARVTGHMRGHEGAQEGDTMRIWEGHSTSWILASLLTSSYTAVKFEGEIASYKQVYQH